MNENSKELLKIIPDYDEFIRLTDEIGELSFLKLKTEKDIKAAEADVVKECSINKVYFQNDKPPSMAYIDSTYKFTGIDNSILPLREKLADLTATLEKRKMQMAVYKDMLEVWRTLSANERNSSL